MLLLLTLASLVCGYLVFVAVELGLHQRLRLALAPISLENIPDRAARRYGDRVLFTSDSPCAWEIPALRGRYPDLTEWTANRIRSTAGYLATMLRERLRVRRGDRVAVIKENHLDIQIFVLSIVRAGAIACPINAKFAAEKLHPYLRNIGATVLISDGATLLRLLREEAGFGCVTTIVLAEKRSTTPRGAHAELEERLGAAHPGIQLLYLDEALQGVHEESGPVARGKDEPLYLVHSSGTTGFPKAVVLKNGPQSHAVRGWLCYVHVCRGRDKGYLAVPNNHQAVILTFNSLLLLGVGAHWTRAYDRDGFDAARVVRELSNGRFTGFFGFPITYTQLKEIPLEAHDLSRMRFWATTADASHEAVQRRFVAVGSAFRRLGLPFRGSVYLDAQGSSEVGTPSVLRYITPFTRKFGRRVGRPGSTPFGPRIRIVDGDGEPTRPGDAGRLEVKGRTVFDAYWNNHSITCQAIRDGWFFTGDVVRRGEDGHIVQLDREVDVIHTRGGPVYSLPIEEVIHDHPAVFDVCVYGERQPDGTQLPAAAVALRDRATIGQDQLRRELNSQLGDREMLQRVDVLAWAEFPIGITGKTLKRVFRERTEPAPIAEQNRPITWETGVGLPSRPGHGEGPGELATPSPAGPSEPAQVAPT